MFVLDAKFYFLDMVNFCILDHQFDAHSHITRGKSYELKNQNIKYR